MTGGLGKTDIYRRASQMGRNIFYIRCTVAGAFKGGGGRMPMIENEYRHNADFRRYVDKYSDKHGITVAEALTHQTVKDVFQHCREV